MLTVPSSASTVSTGSSDPAEALSASISRQTLRLWRMGSSVMRRLSAAAAAQGQVSRLDQDGRRLRALSSYSRRHQQQGVDGALVGHRKSEAAAAHRLGAQLAGLAGVGDVDEDVDRAGKGAVGIVERGRVGGEHHPRSVRPLGERDDVADLGASR